MNELEIKNIGRKTSFFELLSKDNIKIEIPIIQRDYAQGRESAKDIRNTFVNAIFNHLKEKKTLHLDFIYGDVLTSETKNKKLTPLDGQQRLTTLFLLHWYLAKKEGYYDSFKEVMNQKDEVMFNYETRISSRDFCTSLINENLDLNEGKSIDNEIRNKKWFFYSWDKDPTINSMLSMLKTIQELDKENSIELYELLTDINNPIITFQFIELENFGLSESLYIKMNARGKALTIFENFKAKLEQILEEEDKEKGSDLNTMFSNNIDTVWTDYFWNYRDRETNIFDNEFMKFVTVILCNTYGLQANSTPSNIKQLQDNKSKIDYFLLKDLNCFNTKGLQSIISILNLVQDKGVFKKHLPNDLIIDESEIVDKTISNTLTNRQRLQFFALYEYLILHDTNDGLEDWLRVIRNLTEATQYDDAQEFKDSLLVINDLLSESNRIINYLQTDPSIKTFYGGQIKEEILKAKLFAKGDHWEKAIKEIENHPYFKGQIDFLLDFADINIYFAELENLDWSDEEDELLFSAFIKHSKKADFLFDSNGIKDYPNYTFERALLSLGDYTLSKKSNWSFLINGTDREISWKRLLRNKRDQRDHIKTLFNEINLNQDATEQLNNLISNSTTNNWRKYMIKYPEVIAVCGKMKFFRWNNHGVNILLLKKSQTNGAHVEYYSYSFYLRLKEMGIYCAYHEDNSVEEDKYVYNINRKGYKVYFCEQDGNPDIYEYELWKNSKWVFQSDNQDELIDYLTKEGII